MATNGNLIYSIFKEFDCDGNDKITEDNLMEAMHKMGHDITESEVHQIMNKHDIRRDGFISYDEFVLIFNNL